MRLKVKEAVIVEGKYDKIKLSSLIDGVIIETNGFQIFKDPEQMAMIRRLAETRGILVLTDSDGAGFVIRNHLKGILPPEQVKHAYIPDIAGKERRKRAPGKEGKLGVEGMPPQLLLEALERAGATFLDGDGPRSPRGELTPAQLYVLGLTGRPDSAQRRQALLKRLDLPEHMSAKALLTVLNALYTSDEVIQLVQTLPGPVSADEQ